MLKLSVQHTWFTTTTREGDPDDRWDGGNTYTEWFVGNLIYPSEYSHITTGLKLVPGNTYYVLYAIYSTGDSFGHDESACIEFIELFDNEDEAYKLHTVLEKAGTYDIEYEGKKYYLPWIGYFEHLNELVVHPVVYLEQEP